MNTLWLRPGAGGSKRCCCTTADAHSCRGGRAGTGTPVCGFRNQPRRGCFWGVQGSTVPVSERAPCSHPVPGEGFSLPLSQGTLHPGPWVETRSHHPPRCWPLKSREETEEEAEASGSQGQSSTLLPLLSQVQGERGNDQKRKGQLQLWTPSALHSANQLWARREGWLLAAGRQGAQGPSLAYP